MAYNPQGTLSTSLSSALKLNSIPETVNGQDVALKRANLAAQTNLTNAQAAASRVQSQVDQQNANTQEAMSQAQQQQMLANAYMTLQSLPLKYREAANQDMTAQAKMMLAQSKLVGIDNAAQQQQYDSVAKMVAFGVGSKDPNVRSEISSHLQKMGISMSPEDFNDKAKVMQVVAQSQLSNEMFKDPSKLQKLGLMDKANTAPTAVQNIGTLGAENARSLLDEINQYSSKVLGVVGMASALIPASKRKDLQSQLDQLHSSSKLTILNAMRASAPNGASGMGQVSDKEQQMLEDSFSKISFDQSPDMLRSNIQNYLRMMYATTYGVGVNDVVLGQPGSKMAGKWGIKLDPTSDKMYNIDDVIAGKIKPQDIQNQVPVSQPEIVQPVQNTPSQGTMTMTPSQNNPADEAMIMGDQ